MHFAIRVDFHGSARKRRSNQRARGYIFRWKDPSHDPCRGRAEPQIAAAAESEAPRPRAADWLWHPWYAKPWWAAIPLYWLPAGAPFKIEVMIGFYSSGIAQFLNIVFLPVTALVVLGFGYARRLREAGYGLEDYDPAQSRASARCRRTPGSPPADMDPLNPLSGSKWIGSTNTRVRGF